MTTRRRLIVTIAAVALAAAATLTFAPDGMAATNAAALTCSGTTWTEGPTYTVGEQVTYQGHLYQALVTHTGLRRRRLEPGRHPVAVDGPRRVHRRRHHADHRTDDHADRRHRSTTPRHHAADHRAHEPGRDDLRGQVAARPARCCRATGRTGTAPPTACTPASAGSRSPTAGSRSTATTCINAAFPVIRSDGTVLWQDGMDAGVKVATPAEMCSAKAAGATILMSIGGAAAGIDLSSAAVADRFVATVVPILKAYNFDGIDIDIETGLTGSGSISTLSTSQANLIRIIDGVLAAMPSNFGLTMAPETAYVTGGSVTYGSIWGSYLPIIKKYLDNGRLWWLNMQYYNGSMYGCSGDSYSAGTVQGFTVQTQCLNNGLTIQGTTIRIPYDKQVPGLPAQPGAGGGYMSTGLVSQAYSGVSAIKGLMTWSINWDGSLGWSFGDNVKGLEGR